MAFDYTNLYPDTSGNGGYTKSWNYTTVTDSIATCSASGYFNKVATRLGIGDNIVIARVDAFPTSTRTALLEYATLYVNSISGGVVTTTTNLGVPNGIATLDSGGQLPLAQLTTFTQSGTGTAQRSFPSKIGSFLDLLDFSADKTGATDSYGAINAAILEARTSGRTLLIPDGTYKHSGTINWAYNNFKVMALGDNAVFVHSGAGIAHNFNGMANYPATQGCIGGVFGGPGRIMLKGNPAGGTTEVVHVDNWHFGYMKVALRDATKCLVAVDTGIVGASAVCTTFDVRISNNTDGAFAVQPQRGVDATKLVACIFEKLIVEGCGASSNKQVVLSGCINNAFRAGTIESGSAGGISTDSSCSRNTYENLDVESNGTAADWTLADKYPILINCSGAGTTAGNTFNSSGAVLIGGKFQSLTNNDAILHSTSTEFITAFTDNGGQTTILNPIGALGVTAKENSTTVLGNKTINTANGVVVKVNGKTVSDMVGAGPVIAAADVVGLYSSKIAAVNFNSANTDNAISISLPAGFTRLAPFRLTIDHASASLTTSTFGLFTNTAAGGLAIQASGTANTVSSASDATQNNAQMLNVTRQADTSITSASLPTPNTVYFRVQTAQGSAATADVTFSYFPLP